MPRSARDRSRPAYGAAGDPWGSSAPGTAPGSSGRHPATRTTSFACPCDRSARSRGIGRPPGCRHASWVLLPESVWKRLLFLQQPSPHRDSLHHGAIDKIATFGKVFPYTRAGEAMTEPLTDEQIRAATVGELVVHGRPIELADYDPEWPGLFARDEDRIRKAL